MSGVGNTARWIAASRAKESRARAAALQRSLRARALGRRRLRAAEEHARRHGRTRRRPRSVSVDPHQVPRRRAGARGPRPRPATSGHPRGRHGHAGIPHPLAVGREGVRSRSRRDLRSQGSGAGARGRLAVVRAPRRARRPGAAMGRGAALGGVRAVQAGGVPRRRPADVPGRGRSAVAARRPSAGSRRLAAGSRPTSSIPR